jgi:hypothetical protein
MLRVSSIFNLLLALLTFLALRWLAYVVGVGFAWCLGRAYVLSMVRPVLFSSSLLFWFSFLLARSCTQADPQPTLSYSCQTLIYVNRRVYGLPRRRKRLPRRHTGQASPSHSLVRKWLRILAGFVRSFRRFLILQHFSSLLAAHRTAVVCLHSFKSTQEASGSLYSFLFFRYTLRASRTCILGR